MFHPLVVVQLHIREGFKAVGLRVLGNFVSRDFPVVQGIVILAAVIYTLLNTSADILYRVLDPRVMN